MEDRKNAIGFALSGGGLRGIAHIGALKALYELGIRPQYISGTSAGSIMAAMVAMDFTIDEMKATAEKYWKTLAEVDNFIIFKSLSQLIINKKTQIDGIKSGEIISDIVKEIMAMKNVKGFEDLKINLSIATVDANTTDECIFLTKEENLENEYVHYITGAPLETAIRASMSFPAIYTTCSYGEFNFIDGGAKDNVPVKVLKDMGVGKVLALGFDVTNYTPSSGLDGLLKIILRSLDVYSISSTRESMKMADLAIEIFNKNTELLSIDNLDETMQEGYDTIMVHKDEILRVFG